jgi:hypothetical protein
MSSLNKVSVYLESFQPNDASYDYACYIKEKLAALESIQPTQGTVNNGHIEENDSSSELETPDVDKTKENVEGALMEPAFKDFQVLNELDKEKAQIKTAKALKVFLNKLRNN